MLFFFHYRKIVLILVGFRYYSRSTKQTRLVQWAIEAVHSDYLTSNNASRPTCFSHQLTDFLSNPTSQLTLSRFSSQTQTQNNISATIFLYRHAQPDQQRCRQPQVAAPLLLLCSEIATPLLLLRLEEQVEHTNYLHTTMKGPEDIFHDMPSRR
jgi:hypothetical protein